MIRSRIHKAYKKNTRYPWVIVALSVLTVFFSGPGQTYFISGFTEHFIESFNLSRTTVSIYYSGATLCAGLLLMLIGRQIDRWGHRRMTLIIGSLLGITCFAMGVLPSAMLLILAFFCLRLFGQGSMVLLPSTLVPNWFTRKRAMALSLVTLGGVVGSVVIPPINTYLLSVMPWRRIWFVWGGLLWIIFIPLIYLFLYDKPANVEQEDAVTTHEFDSRDGWTLKETVVSGGFWRMAFSQSIPALVGTGLYFHLVSIMASKALGPEVAAMTLSVIGLCSFPATFIAGMVLEKVKVHHIYGVSFIIQCIALYVLATTKTMGMIILYAIMTGTVTGFQNVCRRFIWPEYYGRKHLSTISGLTMTLLVIGSAIGPMMIGAGYERVGNYEQVTYMMIGLTAVAALFSIVSPKPLKK